MSKIQDLAKQLLVLFDDVRHFAITQPDQSSALTTLEQLSKGSVLKIDAQLFLLNLEHFIQNYFSQEEIAQTIRPAYNLLHEALLNCEEELHYREAQPQQAVHRGEGAAWVEQQPERNLSRSDFEEVIPSINHPGDNLLQSRPNERRGRLQMEHQLGLPRHLSDEPINRLENRHVRNGYQPFAWMERRSKKCPQDNLSPQDLDSQQIRFLIKC